MWFHWAGDRERREGGRVTGKRSGRMASPRLDAIQGGVDDAKMVWGRERVGGSVQTGVLGKREACEEGAVGADVGADVDGDQVRAETATLTLGAALGEHQAEGSKRKKATAAARQLIIGPAETRYLTSGCGFGRGECREAGQLRTWAKVSDIRRRYGGASALD